MTQRDRILLTVVATAVMLGGFWFGVLKPKRAELAKLDTEISQQQQRLNQANAKIAAGEQARKRFGTDYATVAKLGKAVPVSDQVPSLVFQLESNAKKHAIDFRSVKLRAGSGPAAPAAASAAAPGGSAAGSSSSTAPATQAAAAVAPPGSAVGPAGFPTMPFTFKFDGDFFDMERMLASIEKFTKTVASGDQVTVNGRLLTIDGFAIGQSKTTRFPDIAASVSATAYVLPPGEGATAGATPSGPAPSAAGAAPTSTTASSGTPRPATASAGGLTP